MQVFVALLRTVQPDVRRPLVREAIDILTPALPTRLAPGAWQLGAWDCEPRHLLPATTLPAALSCGGACEPPQVEPPERSVHRTLQLGTEVGCCTLQLSGGNTPNGAAT